jgi:hypothetical protein
MDEAPRRKSMLVSEVSAPETQKGVAERSALSRSLPSICVLSVLGDFSRSNRRHGTAGKEMNGLMMIAWLPSELQQPDEYSVVSKGRYVYLYRGGNFSSTPRFDI